MSREYIVTGASGFVGGAVCRELLSAGASVNALVRQSSETARLESFGVSLVPGDLTERESLVAAFTGTDTVVHAAALVSDWAPSQLYYDINIEGTRNVIEACVAAGVSRLLYVSTVEVFGHAHGAHYSADSPYRPTPGLYGETKTKAEQLVARELGGHRLEVAIVNPTWIYGPGDRTFVPELVENLESGTLPYFRRRGEYRLGLVYIGNLTAAIRLILEHPDGMGRRYILNDEPATTFRAFVDALSDGIGVAPPKLSLPYGLAYGAAVAMEFWGRMAGRERRPLLTRQAVASLGNDVTYDTAPLRDLGFEQRYRFPETLDLTLAHDRPDE